MELHQEDEKCKAAVKESRASADENRAVAELIYEENKMMMIDPSTMDAYTRELWDLTRMQILQSGREEATTRAAVTGGGAMESGGGTGLIASGGGSGGIDDQASVGAA
jgi:hypothetical protein